jgi:hypothetical protein
MGTLSVLCTVLTASGGVSVMKPHVSYLAFEMTKNKWEIHNSAATATPQPQPQLLLMCLLVATAVKIDIIGRCG